MRLGVVSDVHWAPATAPPAAWHNPFDFAGLPRRLDDARSLFATAGVDAVVVCGDLSQAGDEASTRAVLERLSAGSSTPVLVVAGNHDVEPRDDLLERCVGGRSELLSAAARPVGDLAISGVAIERDGAGWRRRGAAPAVEAPVGVVVSHFPVLSRGERFGAVGLAYPGDVGGRAALHAELAGTTPVVVLSGHIHAREAHARERILQLSAGALVEAPHEVAIVDIEGAPVHVRRRAHVLGPPFDGPPVLAPEDETWTYGPDGWRTG